MIAATSAHFPVSFVVLYDDVKPDDIEVMRAHYREIHAHGRRLAIVNDARRVHVPSAPMRRAIAELANEFEAQTKKNTICSAVIVDSAVLVGVLTAIRWFMRGDLDIHYFSRAADGLAYIAQKFRDESIVLPEGALTLAHRLDAAKAEDLLSIVRGQS